MARVQWTVVVDKRPKYGNQCKICGKWVRKDWHDSLLVCRPDTRRPAKRNRVIYGMAHGKCVGGVFGGTPRIWRGPTEFLAEE